MRRCGAKNPCDDVMMFGLTSSMHVRRHKDNGCGKCAACKEQHGTTKRFVERWPFDSIPSALTLFLEQLCEQFALFERFHALQRELRFLKAFLRNSQNEVELRQRVMCCKAVRSQSSRLLKMVERGVDVVGQRMC